MPKKTKKQKILADQRRQQTHVHLETSSPVSFQFQLTPTKPKYEAPQNDAELTAVRADITKTIGLAILAIAIELVVYWRYFVK